VVQGAEASNRNTFILAALDSSRDWVLRLSAEKAGGDLSVSLVGYDAVCLYFDTERNTAEI
jgi:hypothetical protein